MGQAKRRGTFEQRLIVAEQRNLAMFAWAQKSENVSDPVARAIRIRGPQFVATKLASFIPSSVQKMNKTS